MISLSERTCCQPAIGRCSVHISAFMTCLMLSFQCSTLDAQQGKRTMHSLDGGYSTIVARGTTEISDGTDVEKQMLIKLTGDITLDNEGKIISDLKTMGLAGYKFDNNEPFRPFAGAVIEGGKLVLELEEGRNIFLQATKQLDDKNAVLACQRTKLRAAIELPQKDEKFIQQVGRAHILMSFGPSGFTATIAGDHRNYTFDNKTKRAVSLAIIRDHQAKFWGTEDLMGDRVIFDAQGRPKYGVLERHKVNFPSEQLNKENAYEARISELRNVNLTVEDGDLKGIKYLQIFTEPNRQGTLVSADFRSTQFDLSSVPLGHKERSGVILGAQLSNQEQITHSIYVDAGSVTTFLVDDNLIVFPDNIRTVVEGGPYITLKFHRGSNTDSPLAGWFVKVEQEGEKLEAKLGNDGAVVFGNVKKNTPIQCTIQDQESKIVVKYMVYPGFLGATKNLITYKVWNLAK